MVEHLAKDISASTLLIHFINPLWYLYIISIKKPG